jgi:hypothetical protein
MSTILITALILGLQLFAQDGIKQPAQVTSTERADFAPGGVIRLTTSSSNLFVEAWDRPEVEITTTKSGRRAHCLGDVRVVTDRRSATELAITTARPPRSLFGRLFGRTCGVTIEQHVNAPRDAGLVIHHGAGYVMVSGMRGEIEATSRSGDIVVMLPDPGPYSIDAKSKFGSIASDFAGKTRRKHLVGERSASVNPSSSHRIYLRMGLGDISIKEIPSTPEAPVAAGAQ